eukprot:g2624.t1
MAAPRVDAPREEEDAIFGTDSSGENEKQKDNLMAGDAGNVDTTASTSEVAAGGVGPPPIAASGSGTGTGTGRLDRVADVWLQDYNSDEDGTYEEEESSDEDEEMGGPYVFPESAGPQAEQNMDNGVEQSPASSSDESVESPHRTGLQLPMLHKAIFTSDSVEEFQAKTADFRFSVFASLKSMTGGQFEVEVPDAVDMNEANSVGATSVKALLKELTQRDALGRTPLHVACMTGKRDIVHDILWNLATVDMPTRSKMLTQRMRCKTSDGRGLPVLHMALSAGGFAQYEDACCEIVALLLKAAGETDDIISKNREKLLAEKEREAAAAAAKKESAEEGDKASATGNPSVLPPGMTSSGTGSLAPLPLDKHQYHPAGDLAEDSQKNFIQAAHEVVHPDDDPQLTQVEELRDARDSMNQNALHIACDIGNSKLVYLLLKEGCDPMRHDKFGQLPLHLAVDRADLPSFETICALTPLEAQNLWRTPEQAAAAEAERALAEMSQQGLLDEQAVDHWAAQGGGGREMNQQMSGVEQMNANFRWFVENEHRAAAGEQGENHVAGAVAVAGAGGSPPTTGAAAVGEKATQGNGGAAPEKKAAEADINAGATTNKPGPPAAAAGGATASTRKKSSSSDDSGSSSDSSGSSDSDSEKKQSAGGPPAAKKQKTSASPQRGSAPAPVAGGDAAAPTGLATLPELAGRQRTEDILEDEAEFDDDGEEETDDDYDSLVGEEMAAVHPGYRCIDRCAFDILKRLKQIRGVAKSWEEPLIEYAEREYGLGTKVKECLASVKIMAREDVFTQVFRKRVPGWDALVTRDGTDQNAIVTGARDLYSHAMAERIEKKNAARAGGRTLTLSEQSTNNGTNQTTSSSERANGAADPADQENSDDVYNPPPEQRRKYNLRSSQKNASGNSSYNNYVAAPMSSGAQGAGGVVGGAPGSGPGGMNTTLPSAMPGPGPTLRLRLNSLAPHDFLSTGADGLGSGTAKMMSGTVVAIKGESSSSSSEDHEVAPGREAGATAASSSSSAPEGASGAPGGSTLNKGDVADGEFASVANRAATRQKQKWIHAKGAKMIVPIPSAARDYVFHYPTSVRSVIVPMPNFALTKKDRERAEKAMNARKAALDVKNSALNTTAATSANRWAAAAESNSAAAGSASVGSNPGDQHGDAPSVPNNVAASSSSSATARTAEHLKMNLGNRTWIVTHAHCYGHGEIPDDAEEFPKSGYFDCDDPGLRYRVINNVAENPHRLEVLCGPAPKGCLRTNEFANHCELKEDARDCPRIDMLRCHEDSYINHLEQQVAKCQLGSGVLLPAPAQQQQQYSEEPKTVEEALARHRLQEQQAAAAAASAKNTEANYNAMTPATTASSSSSTGGILLPEQAEAASSSTSINANLLLAKNAGKKVQLDKGDTKVTQFSYAAARRAAGCVIEAVDVVMAGKADNCFCAVRPPGHHMGPRGAVDASDLADDPEGSQGFCLLNNIAIGAAYARCVYRTDIKRVAIIDFDVHHGNGTEAIVRNVTPARKDSAPRAHSYTFPWGEVVRTVVKSAKSSKPWLDPASDCQEIFFASIHGFGGGFYPGSGRTLHAKNTRQSPEIVNVGMRVAGTGGPGADSAEFREACMDKLLPRLKEFRPDMLFISAGFDGHEEDLIGQCNYQYEDFRWITQQLMSIANVCCNGRVISVLEGGYNTRAGFLSPFARSVRQHIRVLMSHSRDAKPRLTTKKRSADVGSKEMPSKRARNWWEHDESSVNASPGW